jgi:hypothetical protein
VPANVKEGSQDKLVSMITPEEKDKMLEVEGPESVRHGLEKAPQPGCGYSHDALAAKIIIPLFRAASVALGQRLLLITPKCDKCDREASY